MLPVEIRTEKTLNKLQFAYLKAKDELLKLKASFRQYELDF